MGGKFSKRCLRDMSIDGKTVLVRVDYNVPIDDEGNITDDFRILASLPTLHELIKRRCKIVLIAHLGRPDGKPNKKESLEPVAHRLMELLHRPVKFVSDCVGDKVVQASKRLHPCEVLLCENLRFHVEEEKNDEKFARALAHDSGARYFVQDGFGVVHRAHASTDAITHFLPSCAGLLLEREYRMITGAMNHPKHPFVAVLGGAKISDKIPVIEKFIQLADTIIIGGAMANTFLSYRGYAIGASKTEEGCDEVLKRIYEAAAKKTDAIDNFLVLPRDVAVAKTISLQAKRVNKAVNEVAEKDIILDVGYESIEATVKILEQARTVVWNGTLGYAELEQFAYGSARVALALAQAKDHVTSIVGGGDTADFVMHWDGHDGASFSHVSTGGGASIELMSGAKLPGIEALLDA